ncbi:Meiosis-specific serine/threonine-protein kinase mek1 [Tulasnella sp. 403]|nr:Meiosis-specific serine/threonine-protein kinase mek1 [Tulasnella sp. 403]
MTFNDRGVVLKKRRRLLSNPTIDLSAIVPSDDPFRGYHAKLTTMSKPGVLEEIYIGLDRPVMDVSTNGTLWNGHLIRKSAIIIADGDILQIPQSQAFRVRIRNKHETNVQSSQTPTKQPDVQYKALGHHLVSNQYLGTGSFGTVRLAIDKNRHRQVACKTIWTNPQAGHNATKAVVRKEIDILRTLHHPNINNVTDVFYEDDKQLIHIFLELCTGGDLLQFIELRGQLNDGESKFIGFQLMQALQYLHSRQISHRDLKPENVLLYAPGSYPRVMLADFGFARPNAHERTNSICGTVSYVPPEALSALYGYRPRYTGYSGIAFDCWSLGVCLYFMISGRHPFDYGFEDGDTDDQHDPKRRRVESSTDRPKFDQRASVSTVSFSGQSASSSKPSQSDRTRGPPAKQDGVSASNDRAARDASDASKGSTYSVRMIKQRIMSGPVKFLWSGWDDRHDAEMLVRKLLQQNPTFRLTVSGALQSDWIVNDLPALQRLYLKKVGAL